MYRSLINYKKIKYTILNELVMEKLKGIQEVNCFISLDSILKSFYTIKPDIVAESLSQAKPNALSSEIINVVAHYRHFFYSRYGISSNYFIYYSFDMADYCCERNLDYKSTYYNKRMGNSEVKEYRTINENIEHNIELIKIITEYLPNIYFIDTGSLEPACFPQIIMNKNKKKPYIHNFIMTSNKNEFQMVNNKYTSVIYLNSDNSKLYDKNNLIATLVKDAKSSDFRKDVIKNIGSELYVPILAFCGYKSYDLKGQKGCGNISILKKLLPLVKENKISNIEYTTLDDILQFFPKFDAELINKNYEILNLKNLANNISNKEMLNLKKQISNKSDNMSLMEINSKYYEENPLMLIELMEGEE